MDYCAVNPRDRFPDQPDPAFYVQLTEPTRGYRPGDTIAGRIVCQTDPEDETPIAVHVVLEGKSAVVVEAPTRFESEGYSRVPLVWKFAELAAEEPVYAAPVGFEDSPTAAKPLMKFVSFPFCFEIPHVSQETRTDDRFDIPFWNTAFNKAPGLFQRKPGHALPPTLTFGPRGTHTEIEGYVSYRILAAKSTVRREQRNDRTVRLMKTAQVTQHPFWMVGGTPSAQRPTGSATVSKRLLFSPKRLAPTVDRPLVQRAVKVLFGKPLPGLYLQNEVSMPECVYLGNTFELLWTIGQPKWAGRDPDAHLDTSWLPDATSVRTLTVEISRTTGARAPLDESSFQDTVWKMEFAPGEVGAGEEDTFGRTEDGWPIVRVPCGPLPPHIVPSCGALNLYYQYRVHFVAKVECAGDSWETGGIVMAQFARKAAGEGPPGELEDMGPYAPSSNDVPRRELASTLGRKGKRAAVRTAFMVFGIRS